LSPGFGKEHAERAAKGERAQPPRAGLVEDRELGVESRGEGMDAQQPCAEAVEGADRGALGVARGLALAQLQQARAHPLAQLRGGALGEGDRQDPSRGDVVLAHRPHEALDQHRGLAAAGARGKQQRTAAARRRLLLLGREGRGRGNLDAQDSRRDRWRIRSDRDVSPQRSHRQIDGYMQPLPPNPQVVGRDSNAPARA
jgi:hypothetical protein